MIAKAGQPFFWQLFEYVAGHRLDSLSCGDGLAVLQGGLDSPVALCGCRQKVATFRWRNSLKLICQSPAPCGFFWCRNLHWAQ